MAARKRIRTREAQLAFEALSIEGGLLSPDWLSRAAQLGAGGQSEADYRVPKGLALRDEIGRYWRIAQAQWSDLAAGRAGQGDARPLAERFVGGLLRDCFGFGSLAAVEPAVLSERSYPIGFAALAGRVPVIIAPAGSGVDALSPAFGDGGRRRSAFGLAQEYLNAQEGALWGLVSDGLTLRIVRDNASLTRPAWIEADLQRIFTEERYADFAALWLLAHETRFGRPDQPVTDCSLEAWRNAGREEGTRARDHLRRGVEEALIAFGQGFLGHPDNVALRAALQSGALPTRDYFNQLLRLVYRLLFLLTVEERGVLHPEDAGEQAKGLYAAGYGLRRLRERSVRRSAHDRHSDLWEATKIVFRGVERGEPRLGLPALAGIFAQGHCPALDTARLENRALLLGVFKLSWLREAAGLSRVNWRDMGPEELGSVYESLLELVPRITQDGRQFAFAEGRETKGNARKTTGSYYTPDSLVQVLLDSALEPVVKDTLASNPGDPVAALLGLAVVDPACGSGHFLLAAARRLASHVARLQANGTPSAAEFRHAVRQVVGRCIHGVDLNPMAVELCKVSLWMEAVEPGLPLTFLDSHVQHGNALLGTTPELMANGIPDAAWDPIEGDDKKIASALKKRNQAAKEGGQRGLALFSAPTRNEAAVVARAVAELEAASDANPEALTRKQSQWDGILGSAEYRHQKLVADAWCAAFVWPKQPGPLSDAAPTNELWRQLRDGQGAPSELTTRTVAELAEQYRFFHWHLQFPQVFARGGFDVVLGNPPYLFGEARPRIPDFYSLRRGQWDVCWLFVERSLQVAGPGRVLALVLPDSILARTDPGVVRAHVRANCGHVQAWHVGTAFAVGVSVFCLVTTALGDGDVVLFDATRSSAVRVATNKDEGHQAWTHSVPAVGVAATRGEKDRRQGSELVQLGEMVVLSRGEELGKKNLERSRGPLPEGFVELLAGECIERLYEQPLPRHRAIAGVLRKKAENYLPPKVVTVKTGRSLRAAIDHVGYVTLQSIYNVHVAKSGIKAGWTAEFVCGLLNSRVVNEAFIHPHTDAKKLFPQITQEMITAIRIRHASELEIASVTSAVQRLRVAPGNAVAEDEIERVCEGLLGRPRRNGGVFP